MSKILLVNPLFNISKDNYQTSISVGILSLASYLCKHGVEVKIIDCLRQDNFLEILKKELPSADIVGLSVMTMQVDSALNLSKLIKSDFPQLPLIWGGVHPTLFPSQVASHPVIDVAVFSEGEKTLLEIIRAMEGSKDFKNIQGIAFKNEQGVKVNKARPFLNMDEEIPLFNWSLMPQEILEKIILVPTHTSRGCPHQCAFCINSITCNRWRGYSADKVLEDLNRVKENPYLKDKPMRFWDENFFTSIKRAKEIIQGMIDKNLNIDWETTVRVDYIRDRMIDEELLGLLRKSGCYLFSYGGESGSEKVLKKINKGINPEQIVNSAEKTLKHKIIPQYSFMVGIPGEEKEDIKKTVNVIDRLAKLSSDIQILGPQAFRPYPGSELYRECVISGWQEPQSLDEWAELVRDELNYLSPVKFPWLKGKVELVESLEAYVRFGAHSIKSALSSTVKANKLLKLPFILLCKLRWKLKFFKWPIEFKIARKFITKS